MLITRTLGKIGVLDRAFVMAMRGRRPQANEWWYCEAVRETGAGTERGLWVLKPLQWVERTERQGFLENDIAYLFPGAYDIHRAGNTLLVYPKRVGPNWIISNPMRRHLMRKYRQAEAGYEVNSVVVVFDHAVEWPKEMDNEASGR